jgi:hypothetical protein
VADNGEPISPEE